MYCKAPDKFKTTAFVTDKEQLSRYSRKKSRIVWRFFPRRCSKGTNSLLALRPRMIKNLFLELFWEAGKKLAAYNGFAFLGGALKENSCISQCRLSKLLDLHNQDCSTRQLHLISDPLYVFTKRCYFLWRQWHDCKCCSKNDSAETTEIRAEYLKIEYRAHIFGSATWISSKVRIVFISSKKTICKTLKPRKRAWKSYARPKEEVFDWCGRLLKF